MGERRKENLSQAEGTSCKSNEVSGAQTARGRNVLVWFGGEGVKQSKAG